MVPVCSAPVFGPLLRTNIVARRLGKSVRTVRWYAESGRLRAVRQGKLWFFDPQDVEAFRLQMSGAGRAA